MIQLRSHAVCLALIFFLLAWPAFALDSGAVQRELKQVISGRDLVLRTPYAGSELRYDSQGKPLGNLRPGGWFIDGAVRVEQVFLDSSTLRLTGKRRLSFYTAQHESRTIPAKRKVVITISLDSSADTASIEQVLGRIFFRDGEQLVVPAVPMRFLARIPDEKYELCKTEEGRGAKIKGSSDCRFPRNIADPVIVDTLPDGQHVYLLTAGVSQAVAVHNPNPLVRANTSMDLTIDQAGQVVSVVIHNTPGHYREERLIAALADWEFEPARLKSTGAPVASCLAIAFTVR